MKIRQTLACVLILSLLSCVDTARAQRINTIAGLGTNGYTGDGLTATAAELNKAVGIARDATGNIYIADEYNHCIRKIATSGIISTVVGTGIAGFSGDGGPATAAKLNYPIGIVFDAAGNLLIADASNSRIRKVTPSGTITTIAGTGARTYTGDGVAAVGAAINLPQDIATDAAGNIYIADRDNHRIRKINTSGIISTIAGTGVWGYSGDGLPATNATLTQPSGLAVSATGDVYFTDLVNYVVRKINPSGIISRVAGNGIAGYSGDGGPATAAQLKAPGGLAIDANNNLYISDFNDNRIRKVSASGLISSVAGIGSHSYSGDGGAATAAELNRPFGIEVDDTGSIYIADWQNNRIRKINGNHPPRFTRGRSQSVAVCNYTTGIDSLLTINDADTSETENWSLITAPAHGVATTLYMAISTGGTMTPSGLTYTPTTGYIGADSFTVRITDGKSSDSTHVHLMVNYCPLGDLLPQMMTTDRLIINPNPNNGALTIMIATQNKEECQVTVTDVMSKKWAHFILPANTQVTKYLDFPAGIYFINAHSAACNLTEKIMIIK